MTGARHLQLGDFAQALSAGQAAVTHGPEEEWGHRICARRAGPARPHPRLRQAGRARGRPARPRGGRRPHRARRARCRPPATRPGAVAAARHAIELDPHDADAHSTLGEIMFEQDRPDDAIPAYEARARAGPGGRRRAQQPRRRPPARPRARRDRRAVRGRRTAGPAPGRRPPQPPPHRPGGPQLRVPALEHGRARVRRASPRSATRPSVPFFAAVRVVFETIRALEVRRLSAPTRQLLADDRRARRLKPRRWDWRWPFASAPLVVAAVPRRLSPRRAPGAPPETRPRASMPCTTRRY